MSTSTALSVSGLTKCYGRRTVVDNLDIELPTGVIAGFVGPNGAGKTTAMAMLLGLVRRDGGTGTVLGRSIDDPAAYLSCVGALVEHPAFYPALTGVENLRMFATVGGHDRAMIPALLDLVGLGARGDDRYRTYSMGMKQRLGIAAALLGDPALLILDEPANGLDPQGVAEMRGLVGQLARDGRTVLVSSHDLSELEQVCDWLVLINEGRALYQGPTRQLLDDAAGGLRVAPERGHDAVVLEERLLGLGHEIDFVDGSIVVRVEGDAAGVAASVNRAAFDAGIVLVELSPVRGSLEDRYLSLVNGGAR